MPEASGVQTDERAEPATMAVGEFESLLEKEFQPRSDEEKRWVAGAVRALADQALTETDLIADDPCRCIEAIIAEIDSMLTEQINLILHHEEFKALEGAWRGLSYLVNHTDTDETLKIRVMSISKKEVAGDFFHG